MVKEKTYHHGNLREALIAASLAIVAAEGVDRLTTSQAAKDVGVSSGAPYRHFGDRHELLRAVAGTVNKRLNDALTKAAAAAKDDEDPFFLTGVAFVTWAANNPRLYQLVMDPEYTDFNADSDEENFWKILSEHFNSSESSADSIAQSSVFTELAGRSMAYGLAGMFASGLFDQVGISTDQAEALTRRVFASLGGLERESS